MNLRHIDPGSTDWMDAMLEGELEGKQRHGKREAAADQKTEGESPVLGLSASGAGSGTESHATRPPPGR